MTLILISLFQTEISFIKTSVKSAFLPRTLKNVSLFILIIGCPIAINSDCPDFCYWLVSATCGRRRCFEKHLSDTYRLESCCCVQTHMVKYLNRQIPGSAINSSPESGNGLGHRLTFSWKKKSDDFNLIVSMSIKKK